MTHDRGRILVVDDEPGMLRAVERVLSADYDTLAVETPADALARGPAFQPDLALLDVRMPGMTGLELMDRLREGLPGLDVILMTGSVSETDATHVEALLRKAFYFIQKPFDRQVLLTLVERCLGLRRLAAENRRYLERLERQLGEARAFQASLLPALQARLGSIDVAARWVPSAELGGDLFDYGDCGGGRVALLVADVAGHGASAAMLTGIVKFAFDSSHVEGWEPLAVVRRVVDGLRNFEPQRFVTLFCARLDPGRGLLEWVNAGHPAGLLWAERREPVPLGTTGPLVSPVLADRTWEVGKVPLEPGDRLLLLTDGILDLERDGSFFALEGVLACIAACPEGGPSLLEGLLQAARGLTSLPAIDDITLLTAGVRSSNKRY
jgi:sigma-B regulation protein RsbU (phosphoserine phosphatase)